MASQSESLGSQDSSRSEDETPTTSDEEFIVSDSEMEEAEQEELEEDDIELLYESFINLREENKLIKEELAKQNNLLWEIYEELKEIKSKSEGRASEQRCFEIMNMNDKHSYSLLMRLVDFFRITQRNPRIEFIGISFPFNQGFLFLLVAANNFFNSKNILICLLQFCFVK